MEPWYCFRCDTPKTREQVRYEGENEVCCITLCRQCGAAVRRVHPLDTPSSRKEAGRDSPMSEPCIGIHSPCPRLATRQYPSQTRADWETNRTVWLPYCEEHYQETLALTVPIDGKENA